MYSKSTKQLLENKISLYFTSLHFTHFHTINFTSLSYILLATKQSLSVGSFGEWICILCTLSFPRILDLMFMSYILVDSSLIPFKLVDYLLMNLNILDGSMLSSKFFVGFLISWILELCFH